MRLPRISIIVPVRDRRELLTKCLRSLRELEYPRELIEIIVSDGCSTDGSAEVAKIFGATLVENTEKDSCNGRNIAFAASSGEIIAFCDSDSEAPKEWLRNAVPYFKDPKVGGVGGPELTPDTDAIPQGIHYCFTLSSLVAIHTHSGRPGRLREVRHVPTCNFVCRREALAKILPLRWTKGCGSDLELGRRLREAGYVLLRAPDVKMWHHKRRTWRSFLQQMHQYGEGRANVVKTGSRLGMGHAGAAVFLPVCILATAAWLALDPLRPWLQLVVWTFIVGCMWYAFMQTRRVTVALLMPMLMASGALFWSAGFLKTLLRATEATLLATEARMTN